MAGQVTYYNKHNNDTIMKDKKRFCPKCRKHTVHKRKDTKKGSS
ncbi:50S ribosomal protein L33 [Patescibacteria group bacterium]|nr:50S ribosomal protein L33 [Patescibacteria group bacterium]